MRTTKAINTICRGSAPCAGLRRRALTAPFVIDAPMNRDIFLAYLREYLVPTLSAGDIVIIFSDMHT
jgi:hypothetical protein